MKKVEIEATLGFHTHTRMYACTCTRTQEHTHICIPGSWDDSMTESCTFSFSVTRCLQPSMLDKEWQKHFKIYIALIKMCASRARKGRAKLSEGLSVKVERSTNSLFSSKQGNETRLSILFSRRFEDFSLAFSQLYVSGSQTGGKRTGEIT